MDDSEAQSWAIGCHLAGLAGYVVPLGNVLGPLVVWLLKKHEHERVDQHGKEALNFQISVLIYGAVSFLLIFAFIGLPLLFAVVLFQLVCVLVAAVKTSNGEFFRYPLTIRLVG